MNHPEGDRLRPGRALVPLSLLAASWLLGCSTQRVPGPLYLPEGATPLPDAQEPGATAQAVVMRHSDTVAIQPPGEMGADIWKMRPMPGRSRTAETIPLLTVCSNPRGFPTTSTDSATAGTRRPVASQSGVGPSTARRTLTTSRV